MINPNALPTSPTVQDFQNLESALDSSDYNDTLQAMQYMKRRPTGGLNRLPQVTVPMQEGGMMEEAMMEQQMLIEPMNSEEQAMMMEQVEQQEPREPNPEIQAMAQQVASYGRGGDKLLLHIRPDEMQGLASMLTVTINPTTGMPEVFLNKVFKAATSIPRSIAKGAKKVVKSKAFKTLAPIALAIAAPYAAAYFAPATFGVAGVAGGLSAQVAAMGPIAFGASTGLGSLAGNLLAGRSFKDSAKAALITGGTAGIGRGISNKMAGKTFMGNQTEAQAFDTKLKELAADPRLPLNEGVSTDAIKTPFEQTKVGKDIAAIEQATGLEGVGTEASPNLLERTTAKIGKVIPTSVKEIGSAIGQDFNPLTKQGAMNLLSKGATADLGASVVEIGNMQNQSEEEALNELENMGYTITGFGTQRVITDPSGVTLPATLTAQQILDRAVGGGSFQFTPRPTFETVETKEGGLINLAAGGEFSGMVPGEGGGMDDNVYMPIKEGRKQVGTLAVSPTEYVVDSYTMAALGDGNPEEGAKVMDETIKQVRQKAFGNTKQPKEIDGLAALKPMIQGV